MDLYIDPALPIGLSKWVYLLTIPWCVMVWWKSLKLRRYDHRIKVLFVIQSFLIPIYSVYAFCYVYNIGYTATIGYFGWAGINFILFGTDAMMASALYSVLKKRNRQDRVANKLRQKMQQQRSLRNRLW